ncbi:MAG: T9SS type A sorting domain-containing protein [Taibaiella sp.]|nr:T9SS type A sorting domain-containing protein [Taibaiella sp.]
MKKALLPIVLLLGSALTNFGQTTSTVLFDNYTSTTNNDLKNNFTGNYTFEQVANSGISGGAVNITGNSTYGGHENDLFAIFKDTFDINAATIKASICFKHAVGVDDLYPSTILKIQTAGAPEWTISHYIQAEVSIDETSTQKFDLTMKGVSHSASNGLAANALIPGNWYRLSLTVQKNTAVGATDSLECTALLENLGASGTASPQVVSSKTSWFRYVYDFYNTDYSLVVGIVGNKDGGVTHLDNFSVTGVLKNGSTSINPINLNENIRISTFVNDKLQMYVDQNLGLEYHIFNNLGQLQEKGNLRQYKEVNLSNYSSGLYHIKFRSTKGYANKKFTKM